MYHFVKLENNTWYLQPHTEQDVLDHFNKVMRREFTDGFEDRKEGTYVIKGLRDPSKPEIVMNHPSSPWRIAVEMEEHIKNQSWLEAACGLEERTLRDRLQLLKAGRTLMLANGLTYIPLSEKNPMQIIDEVWKEELVYPLNTNQYDYDKVEYYKNAEGKWEARVDGIQIRSKFGRTSWTIKAYAKEVARKFCNGLSEENN